MATIPKFNELSRAIQVAIILAVGVGLWALTENVWPLPPLREQVVNLQMERDGLEGMAVPLRPFRENLGPLLAENLQLELQLENLQRIVPEEKEVDNFVRLVQAEALSVGISLRRFTAQPVTQQEFYVEVPFEVEMDGPFYDVMQFYDRLSRMERIVNVSELRMGGILSKKGVGRAFAYSPSTTVSAICRVTTFFSTEGLQMVQAAAGAPGTPAQAPVP